MGSGREENTRRSISSTSQRGAVQDFGQTLAVSLFCHCPPSASSSSSSSSSSFTELWDDCLLSARCFSAVVSGSERPRTGLLSPVSPNQKTGSAPYADWSTTATVNTVIGQSGRVTHGYRLPQQYLRSISPP